jgi:hypothetical protein
MAQTPTPLVLTPRAQRQLELLARALIGVAEDELIEASLREEGQADTPVPSYPSLEALRRLQGEEGFPGA